MFNNKKEGYGGETVIAEGVKLQGEFHGQGPMIIDGTVQGVISTNDSVEIGATARIEADISANSLVVAGKIKGNIVANDRLELLATARIDGDVTAARLVVTEGAVINGRCQMSEKTSAKNGVSKALKDKPVE